MSFRVLLANRSVLAALVALLTCTTAPSLAATIVYDNTSTAVGHWYSNGLGTEIGDQVTLGGTGRLVTEFQFQTAVLATADGDENVIIRFYANDGPVHPTSGEPQPGTLLFTSSLTPLTVFSGNETIILSGLSVLVPDTFTWTAEYTGIPSGDFAGLPQYDPPAVGSSGHFYWVNNSLGNWLLAGWDATTPGNYYARVTAVPTLNEWGLMALGMLLLTTMPWALRRRQAT